MKRISIILPCHNEEKNIPLLIPEIIRNIPKKYKYEIICVDDGSTDLTSSAIEKLSKKNKYIKGIIFYKNFGHQQALRAGIENATGSAIITMDADFQHPPEVLEKLIDEWEKGSDLVQAQKSEDKNCSYIMKFQRKIGYFIWKIITNGAIIPGVSDFRLISGEIKEYIKYSGESELFLRGAVGLAAKKQKTIPYKVGKRKYGKSSYSFKMFINMFLNGFISFSTKPLRIATLTGICIFLAISLAIGIDIINALTTRKRIIEGWVTGVVLTIGINGVLMIYLGILGEYIGTIFKEVKNRPHYLISRTFNCR